MESSRKRERERKRKRERETEKIVPRDGEFICSRKSEERCFK